MCRSMGACKHELAVLWPYKYGEERMKSVQNNILFIWACATAFLLGAITVPVTIQWSLGGTPMGEAFLGAVSDYLFPLETEFSPGFQMSAWNQVHVNMAESEVRSLLGEPLAAYPAADQISTVLLYSKGRTDLSDYVMYYVLIRGGRVATKTEERWDD